MGALPKRKVSQARRGMRRSHHAVGTPKLVSCPNCHALVRPHHVCASCGHYRGVEVIEMKSKKKKGD